MMDDHGGPAFPSRFIEIERNATGQLVEREIPRAGMELRDYFAGKALAGLTSQIAWSCGDFSVLAKRCYEIADAMLKGREDDTPRDS